MKFSQLAGGNFTKLIFGLTVLAASSYTNAANELTVEKAKAIVAPLYDALNQPSSKDVGDLLGRATSAQWTSCSSNTTCESRSEAVEKFKAIGKIIPDLKWTILDVTVSGNTAVIRGEATGTPVSTFMGIPANGKSFRIMSIDIQKIENDKIVRSYHIEDWASAAQQLTAH